MSNPKFVSAQQAISAIEPGGTVFLGESCGEPQTLVEALVEDRERLRGTRILDSRRINGSKLIPFCDYFKVVSFQFAADIARAAEKGIVDHLPLKLSEMHRLFLPESPVQVDVALVQVSPPDTEGYCSFGVCVGYTLEAALSARVIIAEVNQQMPRTYGGNSLPLERFDYVVRSSRPLLEYATPKVEDLHMEVARNVARLIGDGATLCLGLGAVPEAILKCLQGKRDLGLHSGLITDGIIQPIKEGIVTNKKKNRDRGKTVSAQAMGSRELFQFIHENPQVEMRPYSYTHDINILAKTNNFTLINSAIEIDLTGQLNVESIGNVQFGAVGGQADYIRGTALSKGGKSITALTSTTQNGKTSRIVPQFSEGTVVSIPRYDVQYVVTEYGIAELWGKTLTERRKALIAIAHPKFRDELHHACQPKAQPVAD